MVELTPKENDVFKRVHAWGEALTRARRELFDLDRDIAKLQQRRAGLQSRVTGLDTRIQAALDQIKQRNP